MLLDELEYCIPSGKDVESEYEAGMLAKVIDKFLYSIDTESRIIFARRYWYMDSVASIAARYQMSESKVKSVLYRTRKKLRVYLEKEEISI